MNRYIFDDLIRWKENPSRKPLILKGARQVGKTYALTTFARTNYQHVAYFNFENSPHLHELFSGSLKPRDIIQILSIELGFDIKPNNTLIIFDEIQECPNALNSLKYFNESANEYPICAAGSLLGVTLASSKGFPVGKVDFLTLYPLSFNEFLHAKNEHQLLQYLDEINKIEPLANLLHEKLLLLFKEYLYTGGMPSAILQSIAHNDVIHTRATQTNLLTAYRLDFSKHAPKNSIMKINQVWETIPSQLAKENKKFTYVTIRKGARSQEFENAIQWLLDAGLILKVYNTSTPKLPLRAYINPDIFKIYLADVGLLGAMANLSAKTLIYGNTIFQEFRGALTENYVAQELARQAFDLLYWTSPGQAELDFMLQFQDIIYPIEVKSGTSMSKKSLTTYIQKYQPHLSIRLSSMNLKLDGKILNCPIYLLEKLTNLLPMTL